MTGEPALSWTVWPLVRKPALGALALLCIAGAVLLVASITTGFWMPVFSGIVLAVSVAPFFLPTSYRLTPEGVEIVRLGRAERRPWSSFRRVRADDEILQLSPFLKRAWLDSFRSCTLFLDGNRREVVDYAERMVGKKEPASSNT
jgi:hypothetical protein